MRGYTTTKQQYLARLRRIEGRVRGLQRQIQEDTYCSDVLQQVAAVNGALQNVAIGPLDEHVGHCVANAAAAGNHNKARRHGHRSHPGHRQDHQGLTPAPPTASATREERP